LKIKRTANAGILLELDGESILLDGACDSVPPYLPTPEHLLRELMEDWPDGVCFTHAHEDHFCIDYAQAYQSQTLRPILGPESLPLEGCVQNLQLGSVRLQWLPTRHLGRGEDIVHGSVLVTGSKNILFTGDAAPLQWKKLQLGQKIDVLACPYAYATTPASWQTVKAMAPKVVVLLHFPPVDHDPQGLWDGALQNIKAEPFADVYIPEMGQCICID